MMYPHVFSSIVVGGVALKNRVTMAPIYLGYAAPDGGVSPLMLEHYRSVAKGGAAMVVVENTTIDHPAGSGASRMLRSDTDANLAELSELASAIKNEGSVACVQINHGGRFSLGESPLAPSAVDTFGKTPRAMTLDDIRHAREKFVEAALRVKKAGFDMVELHGGTGYLLSEFVSPRTNKRNDNYGGALENRMLFPLEVLRAVKDGVGNFPVGYRFLADEWLPDGLKLDESTRFASALSDAGVAYISVMGGTYESFTLPEIVERSRNEGYMADLAEAVRKNVAVPVVAAGRISSGKTAEEILATGKSDLLGLARVLWADPEWPNKVREGREDEIIHCAPSCNDACMRQVLKAKPAVCMQWPQEKIDRYKARFGG